MSQTIQDNVPVVEQFLHDVADDGQDYIVNLRDIKGLSKSLNNKTGTFYAVALRPRAENIFQCSKLPLFPVSNSLGDKEHLANAPEMMAGLIQHVKGMSEEQWNTLEQFMHAGKS